MNFEEAQQFLDSLEFRMKGFDLRTIKELVKAAGLEIWKLKVIHVAGTNGKGSTVAFISSALKEAGYKTASYYSPHIFSIRERIRIDGKAISEEDFAKSVEALKPFAEKLKEKPTYFEFLTAVAIRHFLEKEVDFAVLETGMGGRLDATNIFESLVCVITDLSLEHTQYLGRTIDKIAFEKAGIIKKNSAVVVSKNNKGMKVIIKVAKEKNAKLVMPKYLLRKVSEKGNVFDLLGPAKIKGLETKLVGKNMACNAALACAALLCLKEKGFKINEKAIRKGLKNAFLEGRLQIMKKKPLVIADVAHNPSAIEALMKSVKLFRHEKLIVVFSCLKDKDIKSMMEKIKADLLVVCALKNKRAAAIEEIAKECRINCISSFDAKKAFEEALSLASKKDLVLVCGSHYLLQEVFG